MTEKLKEIKDLVKDLNNVKLSDIKVNMASFFSELKNKVDKYIGDYPTFIEPVHLGEKVKIGDDVLLGPNVYIGANTEIGNYTEISNSIIFENTKIGENFKLENCIIIKDSIFNFNNITLKNSILSGISDTIDNITRLEF